MLVDPSIRRIARQRLATELPAGEEVSQDRVASVLSSVAPLMEPDAFDVLIGELLDDVKGLGPLEPLLADPAVTDVLVTGDRGTWIERNGKLIDTGIKLSGAEVAHVVERIVAPLGLRVDRASPMVDARLADGSRVNVVLPPLAVDGPCVSIRRFSTTTFPLRQLAASDVAKLLIQAVKSKMNIVVIGGTGSGKTTLLNALCSHIGTEERLVTVEDAAELRIPLDHVVRLEGRPENSEGVGRVTLRELVRNALRMRPDRIIVGEVRGPEAMDMLQAMNTGHEGSMSTCHANRATEALWRIETMVMMAELGIPIEAVRRQLNAAVDLVVCVARRSDGSRRVVEVSEVTNSNATRTRLIANADCVVDLPRREARC